VPALAAAGSSGRLLAVDVAPGMVERLADRLSSTGHPAARVELGDAAGLEVDPGCFDAALCGSALFFPPSVIGLGAAASSLLVPALLVHRTGRRAWWLLGVVPALVAIGTGAAIVAGW